MLILVVLSLSAVSNAAVENLAFTIESDAISGKPCLSDCINKLCWIGRDEKETCNPGSKRASKYYTRRDNYPKNRDCLSNCLYAGYNESWCFINNELQWDYCIPESEYVTVNTTLSHGKRRAKRIVSTHPPRRLVAEYNQDIDNDKSLTTVVLSTKARPDSKNPILNYTFRQFSNALKLPYRVRARILPVHLRGKNTRKGNDVDIDAQRNCKAMGMNRNTPNNNNDQYGHMIAYILGGPGTWYNVVPQTRRINVGTVENSELIAPSLWSRTDKGNREWIQKGGYVDYDILIAYNLAVSTRPTGFGTMETHYTPRGSIDFVSTGYWYSNHPKEDPDVWNVQ